MYKVKIVDDDGDVLLDVNAHVVMLSTVAERVHVEARAFADSDLSAPYLAGAIVASEGLVETLFSDNPGLRDLCNECRDFCCKD